MNPLRFRDRYAGRGLHDAITDELWHNEPKLTAAAGRVATRVVRKHVDAVTPALMPAVALGAFAGLVLAFALVGVVVAAAAIARAGDR